MSQWPNEGTPPNSPPPSSMPPPVPGTGMFTPLRRPTPAVPRAFLAVHSLLTKRRHRYRVLFSSLLGALGSLFVLIFILRTETTTESGHLWWKKTTTTEISAGDRLPLLVIGLILFCAAVLVALSALRAFKLQDTNIAAVAGATAIRQRRAAARTISQKDPQMARDLRIGRPDLPRDYDDGGLVDLNSAPVEAIVKWLDLSAAQAARIVEVRRQLGNFQHVDELLTLAELNPDIFDQVRARIILL